MDCGSGIFSRALFRSLLRKGRFPCQNVLIATTEFLVRQFYPWAAGLNVNMPGDDLQKTSKELDVFPGLFGKGRIPLPCRF